MKGNPKNDVLKDWYPHLANIWIYNNHYEINKQVSAKPSLFTRLHNFFQLCRFDMNQFAEVCYGLLRFSTVCYGLLQNFLVLL